MPGILFMIFCQQGGTQESIYAGNIIYDFLPTGGGPETP
jgi:hypothetical protein